MDQRKCIKFCVKNEIKCARTFEMLTVAFGESSARITQVQCLRKAEKVSMTILVLVARARQQHFEAVKKINLNNRRITIKEVADDVSISFSSCQAIFTDVLCMKSAAAKIVPKLLNFEQKQRHMDIAQEILMTFNDDPDLLKKVVTGNESWVYGYDIETKAQ